MDQECKDYFTNGSTFKVKRVPRPLQEFGLVNTRCTVVESFDDEVQLRMNNRAILVISYSEFRDGTFHMLKVICPNFNNQNEKTRN